MLLLNRTHRFSLFRADKSPQWLKSLVVFLVVCAGFLASMVIAPTAHAERIKDLANIQGVRSNQLIGYGLVVGLDGTGDQTTQTPFTLQSTLNMLQSLGVTLPPGTYSQIQLKNVAAVIVTANLPPFAQIGQNLDVTVSAMGNAKTLRGGTLLLTPLKGADGQVYAMSQGNVVIGGASASANGSSATINQLNAGRISAGATVERTIPNNLLGMEMVSLELRHSDFSTASIVTSAINKRFGKPIAFAQDSRVIQIDPNTVENGNRVQFLAALESIDVIPAKGEAKVILNARTGSIVLNQTVELENCAVAHGNLTVVISTTPVISQPSAFSNTGTTVEAKVSQVSLNQDPGNVIQLAGGASLSDVVRGLNAVGATPQDLVAILQAIKAAGSLRAELEII
ncbi:flagellar basal body P-ring protein FlgI [Polynucleobacter paneuropaeus]|jgi:flagellar P-ring protein precursor FlgI|uniref:Flagellar P-ring protein n=2 Tax=Burkholderiaceae TaxID=119060 RepID=A0A2Z4JS65_9BURK|nr:flagellar biosynthesis protein FlgI [Polynucleobacter paneuropaeus]MBT8542937.1 flagellar basal body P-ring protein FlgI [Polynucleobacter paneuropaeus]MBT8575267.1 flagellar basal body P-ring protein FlgI [Polynucleobacter paneuropaeus]MBT8580122.1 flagellar basal body P-ring protein FlgI [Polynucleobacter paneuropaeus]QWD11945.1 flagellar basal body P-ring protein FlgI [Polynucleobacter paneuropaeus]